MTNAERLADEIFALIERTSPRGLVRSELVALIEREIGQDDDWYSAGLNLGRIPSDLEGGSKPMTATEAIARQAAHLEDIQRALDNVLDRFKREPAPKPPNDVLSLDNIREIMDRMVDPPPSDDWKASAQAQKRFDDLVASGWASLGKVPETEYIATTGERASALAWQVRSGMAEQWARAQVAKNWPDESVVDVQVFGNLQDAELVCLVHHTRSGIPKAMVRKMHVKVDELK